MQLNPYLMFNGQCEAAFKFYAKSLGGKIEAMMNHGDSPMAQQVSPEWRNKIMHARMVVGGTVLMGMDAPPDRYQEPKGFSVSIGVQDPAKQSASFANWRKAVRCRCRSKRHSGRRDLAWLSIDSASHGWSTANKLAPPQGATTEAPGEIQTRRHFCGA